MVGQFWFVSDYWSIWQFCINLLPPEHTEPISNGQQNKKERQNHEESLNQWTRIELIVMVEERAQCTIYTMFNVQTNALDDNIRISILYSLIFHYFLGN